MTEQKPPKWPINSRKHRELARQAAMIMIYINGERWTGSPTNAWLAEKLGQENIYQWWHENGRALLADSKDEHIYDEAVW